MPVKIPDQGAKAGEPVQRAGPDGLGAGLDRGPRGHRALRGQPHPDPPAGQEHLHQERPRICLLSSTLSFKTVNLNLIGKE